MAVDHYENFPVASLLLPRRLRGAVRNVYRFARSADDIADEGTANASERLEQLARYRHALHKIQQQGTQPVDFGTERQVFEPLAETIRGHKLPLEPFFDLLSAFEQDVGTERYRDDAQLFDYCRRSANPVGRIMLHLYERATPANFEKSDAICTGLQLTNFWQDVAIDWQKNRVYLPQEKLERYGVGTEYIAEQTERATQRAGAMAPAKKPRGERIAHGGENDALAWQAMMREQIQQARELLITGMPLTRELPGRIAFELKLVVHGGLRILERLDQLHYDIFFQRPALEKRDWILLVWRALG